MLVLCKFCSKNLECKQIKEVLKIWTTINILVSDKCKSMKKMLRLEELLILLCSFLFLDI
jgi:hypothetical protein